MKISLTTELDASLEEAWDALHDPDVFQKVSAPFLRFRADAATGFPDRWKSGNTYVVHASALGLIPMGSQEINPTTTSEGMRREFRDNGRGLTGALAAVSSFQHTMALEPSGVGPTTLPGIPSWHSYSVHVAGFPALLGLAPRENALARSLLALRRRRALGLTVFRQSDVER